MQQSCSGRAPAVSARPATPASQWGGTATSAPSAPSRNRAAGRLLPEWCCCYGGFGRRSGAGGENAVRLSGRF